MNNTQATLNTKRLQLRPIVDTDIHDVYSGLSNPEVIKYYGVSFHSLAATQEQMEWFAEEKQQWWAICSLDDQAFYGAVGLNDIDHKAGTAEIGLWLLPPFWGKGIMTEALPLIASHGLEVLGLARVEGFIDSNNVKCKKAIAKLDFRFEKTIQEDDPKSGDLVDVDVYVLERQ